MAVLHLTPAWVRDGRDSECIARLRQHLAELRAADGLHASFVGRSMEAAEGHRFHLVTVWRDVEAIRQHNGDVGTLHVIEALGDLLKRVEVDLAETILESAEALDTE